MCDPSLQIHASPRQQRPGAPGRRPQGAPTQPGPPRAPRARSVRRPTTRLPSQRSDHTRPTTVRGGVGRLPTARHPGAQPTTGSRYSSARPTRAIPQPARHELHPSHFGLGESCAVSTHPKHPRHPRWPTVPTSRGPAPHHRRTGHPVPDHGTPMSSRPRRRPRFRPPSPSCVPRAKQSPSRRAAPFRHGAAGSVWKGGWRTH